jgi:hypothetical protein
MRDSDERLGGTFLDSAIFSLGLVRKCNPTHAKAS